jgi:hypothetical protein
LDGPSYSGLGRVLRIHLRKKSSILPCDPHAFILEGVVGNEAKEEGMDQSYCIKTLVQVLKKRGGFLTSSSK